MNLGAAVASDPLEVVGRPFGGGEGSQGFEDLGATLAKGEKADAPRGELAKELVGGDLGVEDQQAGIGARHPGPVVGKGDDLPCLVGFGDVRVGTDHLGRGVVLGEEGQHGSGALGAGGHVVLF